MAKKVTAQVKLQIPAGKATPAPPVGTALGPQGVNIMEFCKAFNAKTSAQGPGRPDHPGGDHDLLGPLVHVHHQDAAGAGADQARRATWRRARPSRTRTRSARSRMKQIEEIAKIKMPDLNCFDLEAAMSSVEGHRPQHGRRRGVALVLRAALLAIACAPFFILRRDRQLLNAKDVGRELKVPGRNRIRSREFFPSFFEYQDLMLFHPRIGYYSAGLVDFLDDYSTYPNTLAPFFGQMIAEQAFRMWTGMRKAGSLSATERFTIAEFGAGNGALAESILDYINRQPRLARIRPDK